MRTLPLLAGLALLLAAGHGHGHSGHAGHPVQHPPASEPPIPTTEAALRARYEAAKRRLEALLAAGVASEPDQKIAAAVTEFVERAIAYYVCQGCPAHVRHSFAPDSPAGISRSAVRGTTAADLIDYLKTMADGGPWGPDAECPEHCWNRWPQLPLWEGRPTVRVRANVDPEYHAMTAKAVDLINDWLPPEHRMIMGEPTFLMGVGLHPVYGHEHPVWDPKDVPAGVIYVDFEVPERSASSRYHESGSRHTTTDVPRMISNLVAIPAELFMVQGFHEVYGTLVHELVHAMGIPGHVSEYRHPTSLMPDSLYQGGGLPDEAGLPRLPRLDGEALMTAYALYDDGETDDDIHYTSLGPWARTIPTISAKLATAGGDVSFGAEYRTQWTRVWEEGPLPTTPLAHSGLTGTATWSGAMVGYTDAGQETTGDAGIAINLASQRGTAEFTDIQADGAPWADGRDLETRIRVNRNYIESTQGGSWVGFDAQFRGTGHEAVTGAFRWEHTATGNLTAAFGAARE